MICLNFALKKSHAGNRKADYKRVNLSLHKEKNTGYSKKGRIGE